MPLMAYECGECQTTADAYFRTWEDVGTRTMLCDCGSSMAQVLSVGRGLTAYSESRPFISTTMDHDPVEIRSHAQFDQELKKRGLALAGSRCGQKGCWV